MPAGGMSIFQYREVFGPHRRCLRCMNLWTRTPDRSTSKTSPSTIWERPTSFNTLGTPNVSHALTSLDETFFNEGSSHNAYNRHGYQMMTKKLSDFFVDAQGKGVFRPRLETFRLAQDYLRSRAEKSAIWEIPMILVILTSLEGGLLQ